MEKMNILCATDKNFLNPTYVTLNSLIINHPGIDISFYILLNQDIPNSEKLKLKEFIESKGHSCTFYKVDENAFKGYVVCEKFPKSAYYRLLAHTFLPKKVKRILYLDVDIVVDKNIYHDLYLMDFKDKYLIVTSHNPDPTFYNRLDSTLVNLESAAKGEYFNSGVLLMNIEKFRNENITIENYDNAYRYCERKNMEIFYDQGLLNFMFFDKAIYLSSMDYNYRYSIEMDYKNRLIKNHDYKKAIIHYTGMKQPYKPWDIRLTKEEIDSFGLIDYENEYFYVSNKLNDLCEIWWEYAKSTPVFDLLKHDAEVKTKWFRRNLYGFMLKHNEIVKDYKELKNNLIEPKCDGNKTTIVYRYPIGFKHRLYKIAVIVTAPLFKARSLVRKIFK